MVFSARSRSSAGTSIFGSIMIAFSNVVPDGSIHPDGLGSIGLYQRSWKASRRTSAKPVQGIISCMPCSYGGCPRFQWCQQYGILIRGFWSLVSGVASLLGTWGYNAAYIPADADLHALSNQHRNALHEMRRADEAGPDRATRSKLRCADLPVRSLRLRRELPEGALV